MRGIFPLGPRIQNVFQETCEEELLNAASVVRGQATWRRQASPHRENLQTERKNGNSPWLQFPLMPLIME
jgi:hypothetical protein